MNKNEFIKAIADKSDFSIKDSTIFYGAMIEVLVSTLSKEEKISLNGFGNFELKIKAEREGINPKTNEKVKIASSKVPTLKFGKTFKELFNK